MSTELDELMKESSGPSLTLNPFAEETAAPAVEAASIAEAVENAAPVEEAKAAEPEIQLTPEEQKMVDDFANQINLHDTQMVLQYGAGSQKKIADFSEGALNNVRTKDMGEIGQMLTDVVTELKNFNEDEDTKGFLGLFKKSKNKLETLKIKYDKAEGNVNRIVEMMEGHQVTLLKDVAMLDKMYELNQNYYKELTMYIMAGKKKIEKARNEELPVLVKKAEESGLQEDTQAAKDYADQIDRFEKKIYDLELTRTVSLQMAPQIRLIQTNDTAMSEKIQSTLVNTIPLWKNQMVIAIGLQHSTEAAAAQREVSDMTNALLKKNAETLKAATIETAKESERGIIDIETLTATNQTLISTLDEVMKIQEEGKAKRASAEVELQRIEKEMHDKLLTMSKNYK